MLNFKWLDFVHPNSAFQIQKLVKELWLLRLWICELMIKMTKLRRQKRNTLHLSAYVCACKRNHIFYSNVHRSQWLIRAIEVQVESVWENLYVKVWFILQTILKPQSSDNCRVIYGDTDKVVHIQIDTAL